MKKQYSFFLFLFLALTGLRAQTYCTPVVGSSTGYYLKKAIFSDQSSFYYDANAYQAYVDNSATQMVTSYPGSQVNVQLEFIGGGSKANVWVDWNSDGDFDDFYENPIVPSSFQTVNEPFFIPPSQVPGIYRIRVQSGGGFGTTPSACGPTTMYGNFVDFSLKIVATPSCLVPTNLVPSSITNNSATIAWDAPTSSPSSYEYYYTNSTVVPDINTAASGTSTTTSKSISGLSSFTSYYYYVRSVCGGTKTDWSLRGVFKTKCDPMTSMF